MSNPNVSLESATYKFERSSVSSVVVSKFCTFSLVRCIPFPLEAVDNSESIRHRRSDRKHGSGGGEWSA